MVIVALILHIKKRREPFRPIIRPRSSTSTSFANPSFRDLEENDPLVARLASGRYAHPLDEAISLQDFEAAEGRVIDSNDPATFEPTAPPPPYSPPTGNVGLQDVELGHAAGASANPEAARSDSPNFFSAFDRWMRKKKKKTQVPSALTDADDDIGCPEITDADL